MKFKKEFNELIKAEGFVPHQVFNGNETDYFRKKLPICVLVTEEEKALPGHEPMKDRLTLLMCGNVEKVANLRFSNGGRKSVARS